MFVFSFSIFVILTGVPELVNAMSSAAVKLPRIRTVYGVDFSGAAQSGRTAWLAEFVAQGKGSLQLNATRAAGTIRRFSGKVRRLPVFGGCDFGQQGKPVGV